MSNIPNRPHDNLLTTYGFRGFPSFGFLDDKGNLLSAYQGERSVAGLEKGIRGIALLSELKEKASEGDAAATLDLKIIDLIDSVKSQQELPATSKKLYRMYKNGKQLQVEMRRLQYYSFIAYQALQEKDVEVFEGVLNSFKEIVKGQAQFQPNIQSMEQKLKELKAEAMNSEGSQ